MASPAPDLETALKSYLLRIKDNWVLIDEDLQYLKEKGLEFTDDDVVSTGFGGGAFYSHRWWVFPGQNDKYKSLIWATAGHTPAEQYEITEGSLVEIADYLSANYKDGELQEMYEVGFANHLIKSYGDKEGEALAIPWYDCVKMKLASLEGELLEKMIEFLSGSPPLDQ